MLSTIQKDIKFIDGVAHIVPMEYPNYCGIEDIGFIWRGAWSDPGLEYKGKVYNVHNVEDAMWSYFMEDGGKENDDDSFVKYVNEHVDEVYELLKGSD